MTKLRLFLVLVMAIGWLPQNSFAFDGTDSTAPIVVSMRQITPAPTVDKELIALEVITQDDKNWVKITASPQITYSYILSNETAAPNCATVTTSSAKFEIIEDENYRNNSNSLFKKQRFVFLALAPKPKILPSNCPEYRNLSQRPLVALNTTSFITTTNKSSKAKSLQSNIVTPSLQDESGRTTASKAFTGIDPIQLTYVNQSPGNSSQFCVSTLLLPRNNPSIASNQGKYWGAIAKAADSKITYILDPTVEMFESQVIAWNKLLEDSSIEKFSSISTCAIPLTSQQINSAYLTFIKSIDAVLVEQSKLKLTNDCQELNLKIQNVIDLNYILKIEKLQSPEYLELVNRSKSLRILDCTKITQKTFLDSENLVKAVALVLDTNLQNFVNSFCEIRNQKREKFEILLKEMSFRYKAVPDFVKFKESLSQTKFEICDPSQPVANLALQTKESEIIVKQINDLLIQFQNRERTKSIQLFINCKSGKKNVVRSGKPPKCPPGYIAVSSSLKRL